MAIYDFFLSRNNGPTANDYVGHSGRLFYDPAERVLRISDGVTVGGEVLNGLVTVANTEPTANFQGQVWLDPETFELSVYHNGNFIPTIDVATSTKLGGVKLGPGVTVNGSGQIIIDSEGLDFSFGDLASTTETYAVGHPNAGNNYAVLSTINSNEDFYLVSNGLGSIDVIGEFKVYKTNGNVAGAIAAEPIFKVKDDGQIQMLVPGADDVAGALSIVGSLSGEYISPVNTGVMMHVTGNYGSPGIPSRIYNDSQNAFGAWVTRRFNGNVASPTAVLADEEIMRMSGTAHNGTTIPGTANQRIVYKALGNQTTSNQGGAIELWATPLNTITLAKIATVDSVGITLESGKVLTGNVTGNVTGTTGQFTNINNSLQTINANVGAFQTYANVSFNSLATGANANTAAYLTTATGNISAGNVTATNYTGKVTHGIRQAGAVGGTTLTLNVTTDDIVHCTFTTDFTVAFSNIVAGRVITLIATNTSGADTDVITSGVAALNTTSAGTFTVSPQTTAVITYYSLDGDVANIYVSAVYA